MACLIIQLDLVDTFVPPLLGKFLAVEAFFVFLIVQFIRGLPRDMDEAARIDGCGHWRIFWLIILPLIKPALVSASIFAFIWSWNYVLGPLLYLNSPPTTTRCPQQRELRRRPPGPGAVGRHPRGRREPARGDLASRARGRRVPPTQVPAW